jgi:hypothetical protein
MIASRQGKEGYRQDAQVRPTAQSDLVVVAVIVKHPLGLAIAGRVVSYPS